MRPVVLALAMAACSGGGDGAVLTFDAPDGPAGASRIEIVLASADEASWTRTQQRVRPGMLVEEDVIYYRQRATVDAIAGISSLAGFEVRIEPDEALVPDETFIAFALIYDANDVLVGVGSVNDADGAPSPVIIRPGMTMAYQVAVTAIAPNDDQDPALTAGEGHAVDCTTEQQETWRSGAVWRGASGPQIRLLLPDLAKDPAATDAMLRDSDLDCDRHPAGQRDCDDLRTTYHAGQHETCDGNDTDCDGRPLELIEGCTSSPANVACAGMGVQLCSEAPGETPSLGVCSPTAACGCQRNTGTGTLPPGCASCAVRHVESPAGATPCETSVGKLHFAACPAPGCTIEVLDTDGPWDLKIAPERAGTYSGRLTGITTNYYYVRARYLGTTPFAYGTPSLGAAYVAISGPAPMRPVLVPINLELFLEDGTANTCASGSDVSPMFCSP